MSFSNPTDTLQVRNKFLYYLVLFAGFSLAVHFDGKYMPWIMSKIAGFIPYNFVNLILSYLVLYIVALYILPLILAFIILKVMER